MEFFLEKAMSDPVLSGALAFCSAVCALFCARPCLHYFQLESYQFQGYFRTLGRQFRRVATPLLVVTLTVAALYCIFLFAVGGWAVDGDAETSFPANTGMALAATGVCGALIALTGFFAARFSKKHKEKKAFVVTARVRRLYTVLALALLAAAALIWRFSPLPFYLLLPLATPLFVALAAVAAYPLERFVFHLYFRDAEKRLLADPRLIRVGITGSYGKTSVKFILNTLLSQKYNVLTTPSSFNTPMGVTRVVRERLTPSHQVFIGEMGARHVGEIRELCRLVHPTVGLLTAVGPQHLDTFRTLDRIARTKYELIDALPEDGMAVFQDDQAIVTDFYERTHKPKMLVGVQDSDAWAEDIRVSPEGSAFTLFMRGCAPTRVETRLLGEHNIRNILLCCATAKYLGLSPAQIARGIAQLQPVEHRLQLLKTAGGVTIIDDAFNTNPRGCRAALHVLRDFPGRRIIVTPGMVEMGEEEARFNFDFGKEMASCVDLAMLVGRRHAEPIRQGLLEAGFDEDKLFMTANLDEATGILNGLMAPGDVVLYENDLPDHYTEG